MSQIPEVVSDLSSRLFAAVGRIQHDLDLIRRKDERDGSTEKANA